MVRNDDFDANPFAAPASDLEHVAESRSVEDRVYAGFWQRFVAAFVDGIIVYLLVWGFRVAVLNLARTGLWTHPGLWTNHALRQLFFSGVMGIVISWLYYAAQDSSAVQATLGKRLMGLSVIDLYGEQISFGRATGRFIAKYVSCMILCIGYLIHRLPRESKQCTT